MIYRRYHKKTKKKPVQTEPVFEKEKDFPKHVGGGWYELSTGERVQGKEEAIKKEGD